MTNNVKTAMADFVDKGSIRSRRYIDQAIKKETPSKSTKSIRHLKTEALIYSTIKFCLTSLAVFLLNQILNQSFIIAQWLILLAIIAVIYPLSMFRLPNAGLIPPRKRRADFSEFLKTELRFIMFFIAALFFMAGYIQPEIAALILGTNLILQFVLFGFWRFYNQRIVQSYSPENIRTAGKNVIIIGTAANGKKAADLFLRYPDLNTKILGFLDFNYKKLWRYRDIPCLGQIDRIRDIINHNQVDYIVLAAEPEEYASSRKLFRDVEQMGIDIIVMPHIYDHEVSECESSTINGQAVLIYRALKQTPLEQFVKQVTDKLCGFGGLLIAGPVLLVSALIIKLTSRGPVFFKQERYGKNGKKFTMLKLRTMVHNADQMKEKLKHLNEMSGPVFKIRNDPRKTWIGKILRKFSIDEFPQFINIIKGDMSMVGPRPPLPAEVVQYKPWQRRRLSTKPGATCLWQVNGRNKVDFDEWMKLDLKYIDNWSLKEDARIIVKTFPAVMKGKGAS